MDTELRELAGRAPDRSLERLESDIWVRLGRHERATHASRRLLVLQAAVLLSALAGSLVGRELARQQAPGSLAVFAEQVLVLRDRSVQDFRNAGFRKDFEPPPGSDSSDSTDR